MNRCCPWAPDPTVFGSCPHCTGPHAVGRTAAEELHRGWLCAQTTALAEFWQEVGAR